MKIIGMHSATSAAVIRKFPASTRLFAAPATGKAKIAVMAPSAKVDITGNRTSTIASVVEENGSVRNRRNCSKIGTVWNMMIIQIIQTEKKLVDATMDSKKLFRDVVWPSRTAKPAMKAMNKSHPSKMRVNIVVANNGIPEKPLESLC